MQDHIRRIRNRLLAIEDSVCLQRARLMTEAYARHEDDPVPIRRAKAFAHVLRNMDLDLDSNPFFAGNTSSKPRAWPLFPEHGFQFNYENWQIVVENPCLDHFLDGKIPEDLQQFWKGKSFGGHVGVGHLAVDFGRVVHEGLEAIIEEVEQLRATAGSSDPSDSSHQSHSPDPHKQAYREAMIIALRAVIEWAQRYAQAAEQAARAEPDPVLREAHRRVAEACRRVPAKPARDLFEGLQAIALVHLAIHIEGHGLSVSVGLPDRVLAPFAQEGLDEEFASNLIAAFILKLAGNSLFGRSSKTQAITVGGVNHRGEDRCNAITRCFLEAANIARVGDPHLFLRWHENIDESVKRRAIELLSEGLSMPLLINDAPTAAGFEGAGFAPEDAWNYCVIGCNELGVPGRSAESATARHGLIQQLGLLNETLLNHKDLDSIRDMAALLDCMEATMRLRMTDARRRGEQHKQRAAQSVPTPFTSALMSGCARRGLDLLVGMDYNVPALYERGLTNAANALAAIEKVVFEDHAMSLSELTASMRDNFRRGVARDLLLAAPKWGNDDERADRWALALVQMRERVLDDIDREFGHARHFVCHVVRSLHHTDGKHIAASPDGRLEWTPVCDSIGAQTGTARNGPTATLRSVLKLDAARWYRGGYNLNLTLPGPGTSPGVVRSLVEAFFREGGQELQINCVNAATLRAAQQEPEKHGDLVVRFAGLSARFVDLSPVEQDEIIERAEAMV